ncbi:tetratricopeptide repeat protein [Danxiaibacter flavus]|uniref:Tetratricopeptide repeat protein n=1 Tax=Danxiaibacter flavus TaxID=3049108 RepID=A0ABV3ZE79_9BACT|nr:tetratricopeptide repeat protein [Chitinophagaceae bacterium DXS]
MHNNNHTNKKNISRKKLIAFKAIGILMPFLILMVLELILRLAGYGYNPDLFIEYKADNNYLVLNPEASKRYFSNQTIATTGNIEPFKKEKDENTMRIFVLGESTTIGYPYFHNGSFHRWLQYRLMRSFPEKNFEIINLSLTAVNSYTVLGFAKELVNYQPDAVLIYSGHNEYYGALGVGSTDKAGGSPLLVYLTLALRSLKVVQLFTNTYEKLAGTFKSKDIPARKTRMEFMVADQQIPYGSALYTRGIKQFETNMDATLDVLNQHNIPVFISTLVSNEKDMKPFISITPDSLKLPAFQQLFNDGLKAFEKNDSAVAFASFSQAAKLFPGNADCSFFLGRLAYQQQNFNTAGANFNKATDLDALRFRAPQQINNIIRQLCKKHPNTFLVDAQAAFKNRSQGNIIGNEFVLEHVHPNLRGYALLSDALYEVMKKQRFITVQQQNEISFDQLLQSMPVSQVDSLAGLYKIEHLKRTWPFKGTEVLNSTATGDSLPVKTFEERLAYDVAGNTLTWPDANEKLYEHYIQIKDLAKARLVMEGQVLEHPTEELYYTSTANLCGQLNDEAAAAYYFKRSFALSPTVDKARYLFVLYFKQDRPAEAIPYLDFAIRNGGGNALMPIKNLATDIIGLQNKFNRDSVNVEALNQIAGNYYKMGNKDVASKYVEKVLRADSKNKDALLLLSQLQNVQTHHEIH